MAEYPDNSHNAKDQQRQNQKKAEHKLEKVITKGAKTRKKSEARKFLGFFIPEDKESVKGYIITDIIIPSIKNGIADVISLVLFGEAGRLGRGGRGGGASKISYQKYYRDDRDDRREYSRPRLAGGFDYEEIVFESRGDADLVLDQMEAAINQYGLVTIADLYDLAGMTCQNYLANNYGWSDISTARVVSSRDGFYLQLPRTVQIK